MTKLIYGPWLVHIHQSCIIPF